MAAHPGGVDADAMVNSFESKRARQLGQGTFGCAVGCDGWEGKVRGAGSDVDDGARFVRNIALTAPRNA